MIIKSSKKAEVAAALATLKINKTYSIQEIIDTVKQVCNHKTDTTKSFKMTKGSYDDHPSTHKLSQLFVDMSYQRRIRLAKIINKLIALGGFDKDVAGAIDIAFRPCEGNWYVWDGLRRCIMVGLCGGTEIAVSRYRHPEHYYEDECKKAEAKFFKIRNADSERMTLEEVFKSMVAYEDDVALAQLKLLKKCGLDIEGLNPQGRQLGALLAFKKIYSKIPENTIIQAAQIYKFAWNAESQVLGYGLAGLATLLNLDIFEDHYDYDAVKKALRVFALSNKPNTITNPRINSAPFKSIAYNIATKVLKDTNGLKSALLDDEQQDAMENF